MTLVPPLKPGEIANFADFDTQVLLLGDAAGASDDEIGRWMRTKA